MFDPGQLPPPESLQFQRAEPASGPQCVVCKQPIGSTYYHAQDQVVCPDCAQRIQSAQQSPRTASLAHAALYGTGAALAGCLLYATVTIVTGFSIALVAILVGMMVGKAIRHASNGLGGRPQQILAVILTYFAITTSYIPVFVYRAVKNPHRVTQTAQTGNPPVVQARVSFTKTVVILALLAAAAPFLALRAGLSAILNLFIIFIGLQRAWRLTGQREIPIMGPYQTAPAA